jgi:[NiFe] hydrogenase diaphorase moiety large subunit
MTVELKQTIKEICEAQGNDRSRMMDIVIATQKQLGCVSSEAMDLIAENVNAHRVEVEGVVSFYSFLSPDPKGPVVIRLCNDVVDQMQGVQAVADAFRAELGIDFGQTTPDGKITLEWTPCIGMCDQAPAALINDMVFTYLSTDKVREITNELKKHGDPRQIPIRYGDGNNAHDLVKSMVHNGLRKKGAVIFGQHEAEKGLKNALSMSAVEVIREVKNARLRGRGGAGFPTGMKWEFTRAADGDKKYILCNADEGEPGTFKDRVILTERANLMFEGMTIGGYAIGSDEGVLYLRAEYAYLRAFLEDVLKQRRDQGLLGKNAGGKQGFDFDIRIQMGAGAYICGEETALISSCEGLRGDPKNRPPFPAQKGFKDCPTSVNNVETFCAVARILDKGAAWFAEVGSQGSPSTKLLSVSGDCTNPGVYEFPFGMKVNELLKEVGARDVQAVLIGGPSGQLIGSADFERTICYDDLATGGSVIVFNSKRDILDIVNQYMEFFVEESCGYCTPCRAGNVLLRNAIQKIMHGQGEKADLDYLQELGETVKLTSRCGLGQTSPNPILSSLKNFRSVYEAALIEPKDGQQPSFDIKAALGMSEELIGRKSEIYKD